MVLMALLELTKTEVTDWRKNFNTAKKSPFGLFVFNQEADSILGKKISRISAAPYNYYANKKKPHNIFIIDQDIDDTSWEAVLEQVSAGSDVLYVSENQSSFLEDTLKYYISGNRFEEIQKFSFTDSKLNADTLVLDKLPGNGGFTYLNKKGEILGTTTEENSETQANFVKIKFGKGNFYLHSEPLFLTNYYLLKKDGAKYIQGVFSYLPDRETVWFTETSIATDSSSSMRFILSNPPLKYAWWLFLAGLLLFAIFNAKRRQRVIPVVEPLQNKSVEFVKSIGNLYLQEGDFHDMMAKKAQYFLNRVRTELLIDTQNLDEDFEHKIHVKTGKSPQKIKEAVSLIRRAKDPYAQVCREDLIKMNRLLDEMIK